MVTLTLYIIILIFGFGFCAFAVLASVLQPAGSANLLARGLQLVRVPPS